VNTNTPKYQTLAIGPKLGANSKVHALPLLILAGGVKEINRQLILEGDRELNHRAWR